jgi:hypothetical protein
MFVLAGFSLWIACRRPALESRWARQTIVIDGDIADWKEVELQRFEKWNASFGVCNTAEDLYFSMVFLDPRLAMMAGTRGLVLEFRDPDSKKPILDLAFTGIDTFGSSLEPRDSFWESLTQDQKQRFIERQISQANRIAITRNGQTVRIPSDGSSGAAAARIDTKGFQGFEWRIPIGENGKNAFSLDRGPGKSVLVGVHLGDQKGRDTPGMTVPGENRREGGGMTGGMSMSPMSGQTHGLSPESVFGKKHVWFFLTLATQ